MITRIIMLMAPGVDVDMIILMITLIMITIMRILMIITVMVTRMIMVTNTNRSWPRDHRFRFLSG
ncbi:MAG: hypothetical protein EBU00_10580, partial [Alphaproteobacteria bacterium]|nr:hypothetical protein [Alphaproteobacteria bacterium]